VTRRPYDGAKNVRFEDLTVEICTLMDGNSNENFNNSIITQKIRQIFQFATLKTRLPISLNRVGNFSP